MNLTQLTSSTLSKIAKLLKRKESLLDRAAKVDRAIAAVAAIPGAVVGAARKKRTMSAAGRKRIAAAQKARWAKKAGKKVVKAKRKISAAGRARIAAAQKKRWAKVKAEKGK